MKQDQKVMMERTSALNFASVQISIFEHSTGLSVIYHDQIEIRAQNDQIEIGAQASTNFLEKNFHLMTHFVQSWASAGQSFGWPSQQATESRQAN